MLNDKDVEELATTDETALVAESSSSEKSPSPPPVSLPGAFPTGGGSTESSPRDDDEEAAIADEDAPIPTTSIPEESFLIAATLVEIDEPYTATAVIEAEPMEPTKRSNWRTSRSCWWSILWMSLVVIVALAVGITLGLGRSTTTTLQEQQQDVGIPSDYAHQAYYAVLWATNTSCTSYADEPVLNLSCSDTIFVKDSATLCHRTAASQMSCTKSSQNATFAVTCASDHQDQSLELSAMLPRVTVLDCVANNSYGSGGLATSAVTVAVADATCSAFDSAPLTCLQGSLFPLRNSSNVTGFSGAICGEFGSCQAPPRCTNDCSCDLLVQDVEAMTVNTVASRDCLSSSNIPSLVQMWQESLPVRDFTLRPPNNKNNNNNNGTNPYNGGD